MKNKTIKVIKIVYFALVVIFVLQELFPILFIMPITPEVNFVLINFPLTIGIVLILIPLIATKSFIKNPIDQLYNWLNFSRGFYALLLIAAVIALFLPYASFNGTINLGIRYSIYSVLIGLILTFIGFFEVSSRRLFFGYSICLIGTILALVGHIKALGYILQQAYMNLEIGFYIGLVIWIIFFRLAIKYMNKSYLSNQIQ
ncbi:MAG: hypothetical protein EU533_02830 [Promethearchaeota archaeon]|nr:MAG: hypothetical protein EU533_02830 [Candidatus Lokiarchaeota archaeon]